MQPVRIYEIPACKMVSSGIGMFGEGKFGRFEEWFSAQPRGIYPKDFLFWDNTGFHWLYCFEAGMSVPEEFEIIDFPGGLYAVCTGIDQKTDREAMNAAVDSFLSQYGFLRDDTRTELGHVITPPSASAIMGEEQMDYWFPITLEDGYVRKNAE